MNPDPSSFTREEANFLRVAAAFVTVHHQLLSKKRSRNDENETIPILPSRPTSTPSLQNHIDYILTMTQKETVASPKWKSLVQHLAQQLQQWEQTPQWMAQNTGEYDIWKELIHLNAAFFVPLLVPLLLPQRTNGHSFQLLELALARAPLRTMQETVQQLITEPPLQDLVDYYYFRSGTELLSKWAHDNLLQQLLERLQEAERAQGRW